MTDSTQGIDSITDLWKARMDEKLNKIRANSCERKMRPIEMATSPYLIHQGEKLLNLSSSNYLGIANHPKVIRAIQKAIEKGAGTASSRHIIGHHPYTEELEEKMAAHLKTEAALVFSNGYMMNAGIFPALLNTQDAVFSDQFNHASIVDGICLSGAKHFRYRHNNMEHLEKLLQKADAQGMHYKCIVSETVFSMDGDTAPLEKLVSLKNKYNAILVVDDAHGTGVWGPHGEGYIHHLQLADEIDLYLGTFSKAFGVYGAYAAGKKEWTQYLIQTCRSLMYTSALPVYIVAGILEALKQVQESHALREALAKNSHHFRQSLQSAGYNTGTSASHIIPLIIGDTEKTLAFSQKLMEHQIMAVAIRPPTVHPGASRIRFSLMATHTREVLDYVVDTVIHIGKELQII